MRFVILGAGGQLGRALSSILGPSAVGLHTADADFRQPDRAEEALSRVLETEQSSGERLVVINAAAYNAVDQAETETGIARLVNAETPTRLARVCAARGVPFVHFSTDYVFDGSGERPWRESDVPAPLSAYGSSKLEGEKGVAEACASSSGGYLVFRTSWVFDSTSKNFVTAMLKAGSERESVSVVSDQWGCPTFAGHLARATLDALEAAGRMPAFPSGLYHLCGHGSVSRHGFAQAIFDGARARSIPLKLKELPAVSMNAFPAPARRPLNSRMDCSLAERTFGVRLPDWRQGLSECLSQIAACVAGGAPRPGRA